MRFYRVAPNIWTALYCFFQYQSGRYLFLIVTFLWIGHFDLSLGIGISQMYVGILVLK